jgi:hypothetical protein
MKAWVKSEVGSSHASLFSITRRFFFKNLISFAGTEIVYLINA